MIHTDKPVGYDAARTMVENEIIGLLKICSPREVGHGIYDYYMHAWVNPQYRGYRADTVIDTLETHLPYYIKSFGEAAVKAALRDIYHDRYAGRDAQITGD